MGNCFSEDVSSGPGATASVSGTASSSSALATTNDAVDYYLKSRGYNGLFSQIELSFSATNLRDRDVLSKSDPMVVVYKKEKDETLSEVFRTEVVLNSLAPKWIKKFTLAYHFETVQTLLFRLYDVDTQYQNSREEMLKLDDQQFLGEATCALSEIVTKSTRTITLELKRKEGFAARSQPHHGKLIIHAEECLASKITTEIVFRCSSLESKDLFSKSDPFLVVSKIVEHGTPIPVSKTEVMKNNLNPIWKPLFLSVQQVGSKDSPLIIECSDFNSNGKHSLIGKVQKSLADLEKLHLAGQGINLSLRTAAGQNKVLKSQLYVEKFTETVQHTFLEYLASGFELSFMVAIDFTASNGNPRLPDSLHYVDPSGQLNAYQRAIVELGEVLQFYDSDKRFPAWGFGARPIDSPVSHCFNLNGSSSYCEVDGIQGILTSYTSALFNVSLAGPTLFGPVIKSAAMIASQSLAQGSRRYYVLLVITDGVITDLQETKDALVSASDLPLSILIVGVGGADFKEMEILDADRGDRLESSTGRLASRDIVQFVALRDVQHGEISVVQALLAELPSQFLTYMRIRNMKPDLDKTHSLLSTSTVRSTSSFRRPRSIQKVHHLLSSYPRRRLYTLIPHYPENNYHGKPLYGHCWRMADLRRRQLELLNRQTQMSRIVTLCPTMMLLELQNNVFTEFFANTQARPSASLSYWPPNTKELATGISSPPVMLTHDGSVSYFYRHFELHKRMNMFVTFNHQPDPINASQVAENLFPFSTPNQPITKTHHLLNRFSGPRLHASGMSPRLLPSRPKSPDFPFSLTMTFLEAALTQLLLRSAVSHLSMKRWKTEADEEEDNGPESSLPPSFEDVQPRGYDHDFWDPLIEKHLGGSDAEQVMAGIDVPKTAPHIIHYTTGDAFDHTVLPSGEQPTNQMEA
uniref:C2 domain-containing protein n=1 Tax=Brassica oleracea var. oleracea TaxID=109376 RepID=A0A0D3AY89_BRAOL